jgi:hypothetical protein
MSERLFREVEDDGRPASDDWIPGRRRLSQDAIDAPTRGP